MRPPSRPPFWLLAAIALVPFTAPAHSLQPASPEMVLFSAPCGLSFLHPAGWTVETRPNEACGFSLSDLAEYASVIHISTKNDCRFEVEAGPSGFEYLYGQWMIEDNPGTYKAADAVAHPLMWGVTAMVTRRCYDEDGYTGLCEAHYALLGDEHQRCIAMQGGPGSWEVFGPVVASARLPFRNFQIDAGLESTLVDHHGAALVIAGLREPDSTLWSAFLDSVSTGGLMFINIAAQLAPGATGEAATELSDAVRRGFVAGSAHVLERVPEVFPFEAICRPPDSLSGDARQAWVSAAEAVLVKYETQWQAPAPLVQTCRQHVHGKGARK